MYANNGNLCVVCHVIVNIVDEVCPVKTILCPKNRSNQNLRFNKPLILSGRPWLMRWSSCKLVKFPNLAPNSNLLHSHIPNSGHARQIDPQLPYTRGISHGQTCGVLTYTHKPITSALQDPKTGRWALILLGIPIVCSSASWLGSKHWKAEFPGRYCNWEPDLNTHNYHYESHACLRKLSDHRQNPTTKGNKLLLGRDMVLQLKKPWAWAWQAKRHVQNKSSTNPNLATWQNTPTIRLVPQKSPDDAALLCSLHVQVCSCALAAPMFVP